MRALVTGGCGYIGSILSKILMEEGHSVAVIDDLSRGNNQIFGVEKFVADLASPDTEPLLIRVLENIDVVFNLAALVHVEKSEIYHHDALRRNFTTVYSLVKAMGKIGGGRLVHASTGGVYGDDPGADQFLEDHIPRPVNVYSETKLLGEQYIVRFASEYGISWNAFRFFNVVGSYKGLSENLSDCEHVLPKLAMAMVDGREFTVNGTDYKTRDGTCVRDYVHVEDIARGLIIGAKQLNGGEISGEVFNLGTGVGTSVKELVELASRYGDLPFRAGPRRMADPTRLVCSLEKAKMMLGWEPMKPVSTAFEETLECVKKEKDRKNG